MKGIPQNTMRIIAERPPAEAPAEEAASEPPAAGKEKDDIPF